MQVQSIPAVFAFKGGKPVDGFAGALPESQIKTFIDKLTEGARSPLDTDLELAQAALDAGDMATAGGIFAKIQSQDPENEQAVAGMIRVALAAGEVGRAKEMMDSLTPDLLAKPKVAAACAQVELSQQSQDSGDVEELRAKLERDGNDHQARFDLAMALYGQGRNEDAVQGLLELFGRAPKWKEEAARKQLIKIFEALGSADPVVVSGRKQLSSMLFS
jgi:putative thioredoxin